MSFKVSSNCVDRKFGSPTRKQIIMYLADKASDDGSGIWCSKGTIARECELGASTVKRIIGEFVSEKLLEAYGKRKHSNGYTKYYRIIIANVLKLEKLKADDDDLTELPESPALNETSCYPSAGYQDVSQGDTNHPKTIHKPSFRASEQEEADFKRVCDEYPKGKLQGRDTALNCFVDALSDGYEFDEILAASIAYAKHTANHSREKVSSIENWFRYGKMKIAVEELRNSKKRSSSNLLQNLEEKAQWVICKEYGASLLLPDQVEALLAKNMVTLEQLNAAGVKL